MKWAGRHGSPTRCRPVPRSQWSPGRPRALSRYDEHALNSTGDREPWRWSHEWLTGGPIPVARTASNWSLPRGGRQAAHGRPRLARPRRTRPTQAPSCRTAEQPSADLQHSPFPCHWLLVLDTQKPTPETAHYFTCSRSRPTETRGEPLCPLQSEHEGRRGAPCWSRRRHGAPARSVSPTIMAIRASDRPPVSYRTLHSFILTSLDDRVPVSLVRCRTLSTSYEQSRTADL